ncbi:hypothetical protein LY76DRAFT_428662 [Colletotrichum caudatum]|nr:hypothetical protein LY76DRAFT_428662 [Colletotrichum caudatum]
MDYVECVSTGRPAGRGATAIGLAERSARIDAEQEATGEVDPWRRVYQFMRCREPHATMDNGGGRIAPKRCTATIITHSSRNDQKPARSEASPTEALTIFPDLPDKVLQLPEEVLNQDDIWRIRCRVHQQDSCCSTHCPYALRVMKGCIIPRLELATTI